MSISFSTACSRVHQDVITPLLIKYQVASDLELPSPIKGEVLFLKTFMRYLIILQDECKDRTFLINSLFASVRLFNLAFKQEATCWNTLPQYPMNIHLESIMMQQFIAAMLIFSSKYGKKFNFIKNDDKHFDGFEIIKRSAQHFIELQRLELLQCSGKPKLREINLSYINDGSDFIGFNDSLLKYLILPIGANVDEKNFANKVKHFIHQLELKVPQGDDQNFIKAAAKELINSKWPFSLKYWIFEGLVNFIANKFPSLVNLNSLSLTDSAFKLWQARYALFTFCKYHIFKNGAPEKGLALLPLFGLKENNIWMYWQEVLDKLADSMVLMLKEKIYSRKEYQNKVRFYVEQDSRVVDKDVLLGQGPSY